MAELETESQIIRNKYPDKIPIICRKAKHSKLPNPSHSNYLASTGLSLLHFNYVLRKKLKLKKEDAIFLFTDDGKMACNSFTMG
jgi:GABA(A) receptor-associated protein